MWKRFEGKKSEKDKAKRERTRGARVELKVERGRACDESRAVMIHNETPTQNNLQKL